eukprot:UN09540
MPDYGSPPLEKQKSKKLGVLPAADIIEGIVRGRKFRFGHIIKKVPEFFNVLVFTPTVPMKWNKKSKNFVFRFLDHLNPKKLRKIRIMGTEGRRDVVSMEVVCDATARIDRDET